MNVLGEVKLRLRRSALLALLPFCPTIAAAQTVSTPTLGAVNFGQIASLFTDLPSAQNLCAFGSVAGVRYSVLATGSGAGGAFMLTNGTSNLPYEVQWSQSGNATSGTDVKANVPLTGQNETGLLTVLGCALGIPTASLITIVRATSLQQATAGPYAGTLTIILTSQ